MIVDETQRKKELIIEKAWLYVPKGVGEKKCVCVVGGGGGERN